MNSRSLLLVVAGAVLGVAFVMSCGDDAPRADAADACSCPAAEPPLAGRIIVTQDATVPVPGNDVAVGGANCPTGGTVLGGSCTLTALDGTVSLSQSGVSGAAGWVCIWKNPTSVADTGHTRVICLMPAS